MNRPRSLNALNTTLAVEVVAALKVFDADDNVIWVPGDLPHDHTIIIVRAILHELITEQPELGARCWCGAPVDLTPRIPRQRRSGEQVVKHGA